jgi:RNA-directed DNA polymerase
MASSSRFIPPRLQVKGPGSKSAVDRPWHRRCLGVSCPGGPRPTRRQIAPQALARCTARGKALPRRHQGRSRRQVLTTLSASLQGWLDSCGVCPTPAVLRDRDSGRRHRRRCLQWKHGKRDRRRQAALIKRGIHPTLAPTTAWSAKGPGRSSHPPGGRRALNHHCFDQMGLIRLRAPCHR